jgi:hypothetical protein
MSVCIPPFAMMEYVKMPTTALVLFFFSNNIAVGTKSC